VLVGGSISDIGRAGMNAPWCSARVDIVVDVVFALLVLTLCDICTAPL
jgi:hypothetical protein